jgi:hypothetical protein
MASALVLEELFERADARFLPELLRAGADSAPEAALAKKLVADRRAWARQQLLAYVDDGCERPGHRRFVKTLLRAAEETNDGELLAHLLVAFDSLITHKLVERRTWLWQEKREGVVRRLRLVTRAPFRSRPRVWKTIHGKRVRVLDKANRDAGPASFSIATRRYLQRRVVRALRSRGASFCAVLVDRDAFEGGKDATLGTTNVDYSLGLAEQMQQLRSYRETRFSIDPRGIEVETDHAPVFREEKIDLPASWLHGDGQLSSALMLPARKLSLPVSTLYAVLAHLKTHREKTGPRALRFELVPGQPPVVVVDPWGLRVQSTGPAYDGDRAETIAVWGRRRLFSLARALPQAQLHAGASVDVSLLGSGLPSIWSVDTGGVRVVLALSGWTTNSFSGVGDKSGARASICSRPAPPSTRASPSASRRCCRRSARARSICSPST